MKALLIIDMQVGLFTVETPRFDTDGVVKRINSLSGYFRKQGLPVIYIQHNGTKDGYLVPDTSEWEILSSLEKGPDDIYINKTANDAFYRSDLEEVLRQNKINELYISGCATDFCVNATIHSALVKDYNIIVAQECHTTTDRPDINAEKLIDFHNWLWNNLTPTKGSVAVKTLSDVVEK